MIFVAEMTTKSGMRAEKSRTRLLCGYTLRKRLTRPYLSSRELEDLSISDGSRKRQCGVKTLDFVTAASTAFPTL
jgi:hypothetical protein